jgi:plastocyanin
MRMILATALVVACLGGLVSDSTAGGRVDGTLVEIATMPGETLGFAPATARVPAGPIVIAFRNRSSVEHNLTFVGGVDLGTRTIVGPGEHVNLRLSGLAPGTYTFVCTIHHVVVGHMAGSLVVEAGG